MFKIFKIGFGKEGLNLKKLNRKNMYFRSASVEEERDYLKARVDYLKKRYPNLVQEGSSVCKIVTKSSKNSEKSIL